MLDLPWGQILRRKGRIQKYYEKDQKLEKLEFCLVKLFEKSRELEVGYFAGQITLKVRVDKMKFKKVKLVKSRQNSPTLNNSESWPNFFRL
jgi:hypothetical protein